MTDSRGLRNRIPRQTCLRGLHQLTFENTVVDKNGARRCRECRDLSQRRRERRKHRPMPSETGKCWKGLHAWIPENLSPDGIRCRLCRKVSAANLRLREYTIPCVVKGCRRATRRAAPDGSYVCPKHREQPPAWFARRGLIIVGTELLKFGGSS